MRVLGYARVSTREQKEDRQVIALREFGVLDADIFLDKQSGKDFNRVEYQRLIASLRPGDTLVVKAIDRLGRDYAEILEQWRIITKEIGAAIVILDMALLDTRQKDRDLTTAFIADIVLQILSYVSETERIEGRRRQAEGIAAAKAKGIVFGRIPQERPASLAQICELWLSGKISAREAARRLGISHPTFLEWASKN